MIFCPARGCFCRIATFSRLLSLLPSCRWLHYDVAPVGTFDFNTDDRELVINARRLAWNTNTRDCEHLGHAGPASGATASSAMDYWPGRGFPAISEFQGA